jgi:hypothetical protein
MSSRTSIHSSRARARIACVLVLLGGCAAEIAGEPTESSDDALVGGFPAPLESLAAVGNVVELVSDASGGVRFAKCSGVLIGPRTVLTAAACAQKYAGRWSLDYTEMYFYLGDDSAAPEQVVRIVGSDVSPLSSGGPFGYGADVAVFRLAEDVLDVAPIAVSTTPLTEADIGRPFLAVGYGPRTEDDPIEDLRIRQLGAMRLQTLAGDPLQQRFGTLERFTRYLRRVSGIEYTEDDLRAYWEDPSKAVLEGASAFFGSWTNGATPCFTDTGGPLLRVRDGAFEVVSLIEAGFYAPGVGCFGGTYGGVVANAEIRAFIDDELEDECGSVPVEGYCNNESAIRCNPSDAGGPEIIGVADCEDFGLVCGIAGGEATCLEPGPLSGPSTTCSMEGDFLTPSGNVHGYASGGIGLLNGEPRGTWSFSDGVLALDDDTGFCADSSTGYFAVEFSEDCSAATFTHLRDGCRIRAEGYDGVTFIRQ